MAITMLAGRILAVKKGMARRQGRLFKLNPQTMVGWPEDMGTATCGLAHSVHGLFQFYHLNPSFCFGYRSLESFHVKIESSLLFSGWFTQAHGAAQVRTVA
jgi:hypothetical protein